MSSDNAGDTDGSYQSMGTCLFALADYNYKSSAFFFSLAIAYSPLALWVTVKSRWHPVHPVPAHATEPPPAQPHTATALSFYSYRRLRPKARRVI